MGVSPGPILPKGVEGERGGAEGVELAVGLATLLLTADKLGTLAIKHRILSKFGMPESVTGADVEGVELIATGLAAALAVSAKHGILVEML